MFQFQVRFSHPFQFWDQILGLISAGQAFPHWAVYCQPKAGFKSFVTFLFSAPEEYLSKYSFGFTLVL